MGNPGVTLKNQNYLRSVRDGHIEGHKIAENFDSVNEGIGNISNRLANDPSGGIVVPPNIASVSAKHLGNGQIDVAITDNGQIQSAIGYHVEYSTNSSFTNSRYEYLGPSRNKVIVLPNGSYYIKAYSQYRYGGPPSSPFITGPIHVTGSASGSLLTSQGSGTGRAGESGVGYGKVISRG